MDSFSVTPEYGIETVSRNFKMPSMHYHDTYELYFLEVGTREYFVEDKFFSVVPGEFVLIPPQKLHRTGGEFCVRTLIHFSYDFLLKKFTTQVAQRLVSCFETVKITVPADQVTYMKGLLTQIQESKSETEFALLLAVLLEQLLKCGEQEIQFGQMGAVVAYINDHVASIQSIDQIAEAFYISKYHLCRVFKKNMQMTIVEYMNQVKMRKAKQLLEVTELGVGEIAERCGYHSVAYFSSLFRENTGESPSQYRKRTKH